ncbi:Transcriptional regulator TetR family [Patulibacter medicamentivorans]|uniref:Transcriptional regulator TetR family n=1 Tax=Patulibacter medicamentivorans TaxID=1097667 RepID=H0E062_9ACTN|nr:TetR/AcrR family transcriptional regulator [Patulibacter medicamentivorans]EHN12865.1 Transcriptional regulator TetR family [Patulibacter medicamentivorans]
MPSPSPDLPADAAAPFAALLDIAVDPEASGDGELKALLDVATAEFARYGVARTSLTDIARRAGVSRPTAYRRLGGKDELLRRILVRETHAFFVTLTAAAESLRDPVDRAVEAFAVGARAAAEHPLASHLLAEEPGAIVPHLTDRGGPWLRAATAALARFVDPTGNLDPVHARRMAEVVVRLNASFFLTRDGVLLDAEGQRLRTLADTVVRAAVEAA